MTRAFLRDLAGGLMALAGGMAVYQAILAYYIANGTLTPGDGSGGMALAPTLAEALQLMAVEIAVVVACVFLRRRWRGDDQLAAALEREPLELIAAQSRIVREGSKWVNRGLNLWDRLVAIATFPGVMAYVLVLRVACVLVGVPVYQVRYFALSGDAPGYVTHGEARAAWQTVVVRGAPLLVNSVAAIALGALAGLDVAASLRWRELGGAYEVSCMWLGFSLAMHAFSRGQDANRSAQPEKIRPSAWLVDFALGWYLIDAAYASMLIGMGFMFGMAPR